MHDLRTIPPPTAPRGRQLARACIVSGLGVVPRMTHYTPRGLEGALVENGFRVLETRSLYPSPPNYFIAAGV